MLSRDEPRAMPHNRDLPVINRTIESRWERKSYAMHMRRLQNIKPSVDNKPPMLPSHMRNNRKREQQQHERTYEIEYENAILLEKMRRIMDLGTHASNSGLHVAHRDEVHTRSLNAQARRRDLERITAENMGIVKRIQNANASYETEKWDRSRRDHQQVLGRISRFRPRQSFKPASLAPRRLEPLQHSTSAFSCLAPQDAQQNPYLPTLEAAAQFEYDLTQMQQGRPGQGESGLLDEYLMAPQEGQPPRAAADDGGSPGRSSGAVRVHINANDEAAAPGLQVQPQPPHCARLGPCIGVRAPSTHPSALHSH